MLHLKKDQKGFTFLEVMGAVIILALMVPMFVVFVNGVQMVGQSKQRNQATEFAKEKLEELKDMKWEDLPAEDGGHDNPTPVFTRTWRVMTISFAPYEYVRELEVTVSWDNGNQDVELATYRHRDM